MSLKARVSEDMKEALRGRQAQRLSALRLLLAAIRQKEIDERIELDDAAAMAVIDRLIKQRKDSAVQYEAADRQDLAERERFEIEVLRGYLPQPLSRGEIDQLVQAALADTGATSARDMGKVMAWLKPKLAGRADMSAVSVLIKAALG